MKNKPKHNKPKVASKKRYKGKPAIAVKARSVAATHTFKKKYGSDKKTYSAEGSKCKSERAVPCTGVLKPTQWNRQVCSICNYSELV